RPARLPANAGPQAAGGPTHRTTENRRNGDAGGRMNSIKGNQAVRLSDENIPSLKIEPCEDGTVMLEQDWCGNVDRVSIHPIHLRFMAEKLGMVPAVTAQEMEQAHRSSTWERRLRVLCSRIERLDEM